MASTNRRWLSGGVSLAVVLACACASTEPAGPRGPVVTDLEIRETDAVSERELVRKLVTAETGWWPFAKKRRFDPVEWQSDLQRIERYYETQGYYQARVVRAETLPSANGEEIELVVEVEENAPVRIGAVTVRGLEALPEDERGAVTEDLPLETGEIFVEDDWTAAKDQLVHRLKEQGHAAAALVAEAKIDLASRRAVLDLLVAPGQRYRFGSVVVNTRAGAAVDPALVREQVELAVGGDRAYSESDLEEAQRRVFGMGVFSTARVVAGRHDSTTGEVPVVVDVSEGPFHTVRLGGGVAIDQVRQEARLVAGWANRNFLGGLRKLSLEATLGWAFIPSTVAVLRDRVEDAPRHGPIYRATADFAQPRLFGRPSLRLTAVLESERTIEPAYDAIGGRGKLGLAWQPWSTVTVSPSYNLQGYHLNGPPAVSAVTAPLALGCASDPCFVLLSYLDQTAIWDKRDHPLEPRRGFLLSLSLQEGGGPMGGDFDYLRILTDARGYVTPGRNGRLTLTARLRFGALIPRSGRPEDSPVVARFYAGGANSMRGFGLRRLSPMILLPVDPDDPELRVPLPIGGNGLVEANLEARVQLTENILLAGFLDAGTVTPDRFPLGDPERILYAVGAGLRYLSPIGPIRLDFGVRLPVGRLPPVFDIAGNEIPNARVPGASEHDRSCLGIGGGDRSVRWVRDGLCAIHVSIGEAF